MWMFYLISLLLTLGMVTVTLLYFAGPEVPRYVLFTVGYAWFCSISIIVLVPADIWTATTGYDKGGIAFFWGWSYWSTFVLTWAVVPTIQGFEDAGDFTVTERLRTSVRNNLVFYLIIGGFGLFGLILLTIMHKNWGGTNVVGYAMACSNTFGLVTGAFLLGFGLSEIPKSLWKNADWGNRQKVLSHRIAKMAVNLDEAHQDLSNAIVIAQATSNQMSKRDPLRPCMDIIDDILVKMFKADPSFKPTGGRLGENDMDYDADEKSMATLRRQLGRARDQYYRYRSEYMTYVMEALELEDTIKNYERGAASGWKYISSFRPARTGNFGQSLDMLEWVWRCILKKQLEKFFAVLLGCMSVAILLAEATILPSGVDLSLFSILIKAVGKKEVLVQTMAFVPLMYMCICTYYSLFKIGMLMVYSLTPRQTGSVSLLMICAMVARYAPPVSYNFLNLIRLDGGVKTTFEKRMGNIDDAVPFFGHGFNKIYPLIMVIYTLLVASNFFGRIIEFLGNWKKLSGFQNEAEDFDGFDPSGVIILQKERSWLEKGSNVGEHVIPLARNFNDATSDLEAADAHVKPVRNENGSAQQTRMEMKSATSVSKDDASRSRPNKDDGRRQSSREVIGNKYALLKQQETASHSLPDSDKPSSTVSLLQADKSKREPDKQEKLGSASGLANRWASMKTNFESWKTNMEVRKFLPLGQTQDVKGESGSSLESLDEIFAKLKKRPDKRRDDDYGSEDDDIRTSRSSR